jgi:hypothetical protein
VKADGAETGTVRNQTVEYYSIEISSKAALLAHF